MRSPGAVIHIPLASRTRETTGAGDVLDHLGPDGFAWLRDGVGFVTAGVATRIFVEPGGGEMEEAAEAVAATLESVATDHHHRLPGTGPIAVAALPFRSDQPAELVVPARVVGHRGDGTGWITEIAPAESPSAPGQDPAEPPSRYSVEAPRSRAEWMARVGSVLDAIERGTVEKVVLAREVWLDADRPFDIRGALARLRESHPGCFVFAAGSLIGATPELLVSRRDDRVLSRPVAGTAPLGGGEALRRSAKEVAEHRVVVDAVAAALEPVCSNLSVPPGPDVMELASLLHLATPVTGRLRSPTPSALSLVARLHPTPAVGGAPAAEALRLIQELEGFDRGCYAGPVGWVDDSGDGEWAVALRCAEVNGRRARLFAGAGIVAGSDPEAEWAETQRKLETMLVALVRP